MCAHAHMHPLMYTDTDIANMTYFKHSNLLGSTLNFFNIEGNTTNLHFYSNPHIKVINDHFYVYVACQVAQAGCEIHPEITHRNMRLAQQNAFTGRFSSTEQHEFPFLRKSEASL